jgi:hypothetical protein
MKRSNNLLTFTTESMDYKAKGGAPNAHRGSQDQGTRRIASNETRVTALPMRTSGGLFQKDPEELKVAPLGPAAQNLQR